MVADLTPDIEEVKRLLDLSQRPRVKRLLNTELEALLKAQQAAEEETKVKAVPLQKSVQSSEISYTTIDSYSWDQDYDKVKIYIFLEGASQEKTQGKFTEKSLELKIHDVDGKNLRFSIPNLCKPIAAEKSSFIVKPKRITINLKKREDGHWADIVNKEKFKPKVPSDDKDPMAGIMDLMKNMYEEGDDEMKRTIAKAWTESRAGKMGRDNFDL